MSRTNPELQLQRTPQQRLTNRVLKQSLEIGGKPRGLTTKLKYGYATLYSTYKFKFRKLNRYYVSRDYVGTSTTNKGQNAVNNYPDLIRGAYLNAVYQFREENNVGSKGFSAIHLKSELKYWKNDAMDSGQRLNENDVIKYNPEKVNFIMNKEEYMAKQTKKSQQEYAKDIVTGNKGSKEKTKLAIEQAGYVKVKKKSGKHLKKTIQHKTKRRK